MPRFLMMMDSGTYAVADVVTVWLHVMTTVRLLHVIGNDCLLDVGNGDAAQLMRVDSSQPASVTEVLDKTYAMTMETRGHRGEESSRRSCGNHGRCHGRRGYTG